ncbi:ankyrin repeat-containing domain protein, partial [Baffinella frigidus]
LWSASVRGQTQNVLGLLEAGADIEEKGGPAFTTPLHESALQGHVALTLLLLEHRADLSARDDGGDTPLHYSSLQGHGDLTLLLLENGADVSVKD